jgi:hypothetical protein
MAKTCLTWLIPYKMYGGSSKYDEFWRKNLCLSLNFDLLGLDTHRKTICTHVNILSKNGQNLSHLAQHI